MKYTKLFSLCLILVAILFFGSCKSQDKTKLILGKWKETSKDISNINYSEQIKQYLIKNFEDTKDTIYFEYFPDGIAKVYTISKNQTIILHWKLNEDQTKLIIQSEQGKTDISDILILDNSSLIIKTEGTAGEYTGYVIETFEKVK